MRQLSKDFLNDLKEGLLKPVLMQVKQDETLMLALRGNYVNVYYRGGNLLQITASGANDVGRTYSAGFNPDYDKTGKHLPDLPKILGQRAQVQAWVDAFPALKRIMDLHFVDQSKAEREFQQLVARENSRSPISNETEYFITDIEFAPNVGARFDMLALRWLAADKKRGSNACRATLIEVKYGDKALRGKAGLLEHLRDISGFLANDGNCVDLRNTITGQFSQLNELGLLRFNAPKEGLGVVVTQEKPELVFLLANHNPRSRTLNDILNDPEMDSYAQSLLFDLRFFVASFAGYGMHFDCMLSLAKFRTLVDQQIARAK
jgi:hypothetical protein